MRSVILRSLAVIGAGGLILAGVLYVASTVDGRSPTVLEVRLTQPAGDDAQLALVTTSFEVVFSEPVDPTSAEAAVAILPATPAAASWSGSTLIITPNEPLALETDYTLSIGEGIRDRAGNEMDDTPAPFEFTTVGRPALEVATPADGESDVPLDAPVFLTFTTLMDTASVEAALRITPQLTHELLWSGRVLQIAPNEALDPDTEYRITIGSEATDVAGVALGEDQAVGFTTVVAGLDVMTVIPSDGTDGIATTSQIAVIFDQPIDPGTASDDLLTITPSVAGSVEIVQLPGDPPEDDGAGSALVFVPSGPLPANTTFSVELIPGILGVDGDGLADAISWSFTTGVPAGTVSNQVIFVTDRAGVANVWAMNPDGSGQRQLTSELTAVVDYAVSPDGDSLVVADGRRLVYQRADGTDRRVLTDADAIEFDPSYTPDGRRMVFARADPASGAGLGLWEWQVGGGEAEPIDLPTEPGESPLPSAPAPADVPVLRAPRYSPDGTTLAFVDADGAIGVLELDTERLSRVDFVAGGAPLWLPDSSGAMLAGTRAGTTTPTVSPPVAPMEPGPTDSVFHVPRSGRSVSASPFGIGSQVIAVAVDGRIAYVDGSGALWLTELPTGAPSSPSLDDVRVRSGTFAPGTSDMVIEVETADGTALELFDPVSGERTRLVDGGARPRWLP
ncbi:MAG TPA: Ig-like domain-containing protein [Candidatus Limnocylindria bacterium]